MRREDFEELRVGDVVRHRHHSVGYVVHQHYGDRVTLVRTMDAMNPDEWDLVSKVADRKAEASPCSK
jgi:hypothetical protein